MVSPLPQKSLLPYYRMTEFYKHCYMYIMYISYVLNLFPCHFYNKVNVWLYLNGLSSKLCWAFGPCLFRLKDVIQTTYWITLVHESFKRFLEYMEKYKNTVLLMPSDGIHHLGIKYTVHTCIQYKWFFF